MGSPTFVPLRMAPSFPALFGRENPPTLLAHRSHESALRTRVISLNVGMLGPDDRGSAHRTRSDHQRRYSAAMGRSSLRGERRADATQARGRGHGSAQASATSSTTPAWMRSAGVPLLDAVLRPALDLLRCRTCRENPRKTAREPSEKPTPARRSGHADWCPPVSSIEPKARSASSGIDEELLKKCASLSLKDCQERRPLSARPRRGASSQSSHSPQSILEALDDGVKLSPLVTSRPGNKKRPVDCAIRPSPMSDRRCEAKPIWTLHLASLAHIALGLRAHQDRCLASGATRQNQAA